MTRQQMAAFMRRFAQYLDAEDGTPGEADNADTVDGLHASAFATDGHDHTGDDIVDESITGADVANASLTNVDTGNEPGVVYAFEPDTIFVTSTPAAVVSTFIRVPTDGHVALEVTGHWNAGDSGADGAQCQLQKGTPTAIDTAEPWFWLWNPTDSGFHVFSAHRLMPIAVADNPSFISAGQQLSLVCDEFTGDVQIADVQISGTFFANSYAPRVISLP